MDIMLDNQEAYDNVTPFTYSKVYSKQDILYSPVK